MKVLSLLVVLESLDCLWFSNIHVQRTSGERLSGSLVRTTVSHRGSLVILIDGISEKPKIWPATTAALQLIQNRPSSASVGPFNLLMHQLIFQIYKITP